MIILDTSGLIAALDRGELHHRAAAAAIASDRGPYLLSPFVLAEVDYLLGKRKPQQAARAFLDEIGNGAYRLEPFEQADVALAGMVLDRFADLAIRLTDASLVVLADRHGVRDILTLDERHFRVLRDGLGRPFRLLPMDARPS